MTETRQGMTVLVADDSAIYRKLVQHALEAEDYSLVMAKSGQEALELFAQHSPSIVITDWMMPDISGLELCARIRETAPAPATYILLLTGMTEKDSVVQGLAAGANDYLTKPFHAGELLARIGVGRRNIELHREVDAKNNLLEELAHTDALTGLPNRRALEEWSARQLRGAARHGFPMWMVLADLDKFKVINDTHGHEAGDVVLRQFAKVLKETTRASDICGRLGGDEFLLVVTHVDEANIEATVERFRKRFVAETCSFGGVSIPVTASFGVAGLPVGSAMDFDALLREADRALYAAKHAGRNLVKVGANVG
ncbi:MAG TPA: diguanylate cyclase [Candidatus Acidoferrum sp.]|jgi:diguanylate cyclase (GGDEF)-like protein